MPNLEDSRSRNKESSGNQYTGTAEVRFYRNHAFLRCDVWRFLCSPAKMASQGLNLHVQSLCGADPHARSTTSGHGRYHLTAFAPKDWNIAPTTNSEPPQELSNNITGRLTTSVPKRCCAVLL
jgi:hypothetical protein